MEGINTFVAFVALGNEVIQYTPAEDFSSLFDIGDLTLPYQTAFDDTGLENTLLTTPTDEEVVENLYPPQPGMTTTQNGRRKMEDVD